MGNRRRNYGFPRPCPKRQGGLQSPRHLVVNFRFGQNPFENNMHPRRPSRVAHGELPDCCARLAILRQPVRLDHGRIFPMAAPASVPQTWNCPGCGKLYRIAAGKKAPSLCPACRILRAAEPDESSAFDQLSAIVQAEEEKSPLTARVAARPVEPTAPLQREPSPFEQMYGSAETPAPPAESDEPAQRKTADDPLENDATPQRPPLRQRSRGQRRVIIVTGTAIAVFAAWGLIRIVGQLEAGIPGEAAVWKQARTEVADRLQAPATAEFPKPGEIRPLHGTKNPSWTVKSVVDAKNERGIPLRHRWFLEISYDRKRRQWERGR